jgi:hypothetical protein
MPAPARRCAFGRNLDVDWGPDRIRPGLSGTGYVRRGDGMGWYLFAGLEGRAVAYNAFLDGPWFRSSPDVEKKPFVADFQAGAALTWRGFRMAYTLRRAHARVRRPRRRRPIRRLHLHCGVLTRSGRSRFRPVSAR